MSINLFNDTGPIVQETVSNKPTIITEFDVPSDKIVYFGSPHKFENGMIDSINGIIFVTPYKSIASIFTCDRDKYKTGGNESRITNINYKEWNVLSDEPLKVVHVLIEGDPERDRTEFESIGYIYKINIEGYEDKLQIYDWMSKDKEMFLQVDKIPYLEVEECVTKRIVTADNDTDDEEESIEEFSILNTDFTRNRRINKMKYKTRFDGDYSSIYQEEEHLLSKELPKSIEDDTIDDDVDDNIDENVDDIDTEKDTSNDINTVDDAVNINFDIDVSDMGNDTSDVQNEYNKSEVDELNHLIAAESDAINDYFEAGKNAKTPVLTKLYADIGAEERFHLEQLMYAKSTITGEKYEPRDEKVKAEYEELLNMGMDEETAMTTAVDKLSINNNDIDDGDDSDLEEIQADIETMESALLQTDLLFAICESSSTPIECNNALNVFIESYLVYQEALENVSAKENKNIVKVKNPIKLLGDGIRRIISLLVQLAHKVRDYIAKSKLKRARKMAWLKEHGIKGLFQRGVSLYFYDDRVGMVMTDDALKFSQLLYDVTKQIAKRTGIQLKNAAQKQSIKNPIPCASPEDGVNKINNFIYNKTKVVITDKNESVIMQQFFGYSDNKLGVGVTREGDDPNKSYHESNNVYNRLELMAKVTAEYAEISRSVLTMLEGFEGNINSIYYKNRAIYNKSVEQMRDVCNGYKKLVSAITHDLSTIMKLDNGILEQSRQQDRMNQPEQFKNAGNSEPIPNEDKYVTEKKPGFFSKFKK